MKKIAILLVVVLLVYSCANNNGSKQEQPQTTATQKNEGLDVSKGLSLVAGSDCLSCHKINEVLTGPSYKQVAMRYAGRKDITDSLADKIIKGGAGNWGQVPMTPHPTLSKEDARAMATYILSLKD